MAASGGSAAPATACDWTGKLDDLQQHLDMECGFVVVDCPFKPHGCKHSCSRRDMALHHAHAGTLHAELTAQRLEALAKAHSDMLASHAKLASRFEQLVAKVGRVSDRVTGVSQCLKLKTATAQRVSVGMSWQGRPARPPSRQRLLRAESHPHN